MSTTTTTTTTTQDTYRIITDTATGLYAIQRNGSTLIDGYGNTRLFRTQSGARKRISRERRGDFHR